MPVQVSYPGVYIQEVPSGVKVITGVSTSIAAFFGRTAKGYINRAVRCLSYADFLRNFGGPHPLSDLATSVKQFFDNGGADCYVVRLAQGAAPAGISLQNPAAQNVLTAKAKAPGTWGNDIKLEVDYNTPNPDDTFNLRVIHEANGQVVVQEAYSNLSMNPSSPRFAPSLVTQSSQLIDLNLHADMFAPNPPTSAPTLPSNFINLNTPAGYSQSRRLFTAANKDAAALTALRTAIRDELNNLANNAVEANRRSRFLISVNGSQFLEINLNTIALTAAPSLTQLTGELGSYINNLLTPAGIDNILVGLDSFTTATDTYGVLRLTAANPAPNAINDSVRIRRANTSDFASAMMFGLDQNGVEVARFAAMRPTPNGIFYKGGSSLQEFTTAGANALNNLAVLAQEDINSLSFNTTPATVIPLNLVLAGTAAGTFMYQQAGGGTNGLKERLNLMVQAVNSNVNSPCSAELWGYHLCFKRKAGGINETFTVATLSAKAALLGNGFISSGRQYRLNNTGAFQVTPVPGQDGNAPGIAEFLGNPVTHEGFYALDTVDLFNLMVLPGDREIDNATFEQIIGPAGIYCQKKRALLLLDAPSEWTNNGHPVADATVVNTLRGRVVKDHTAIFYPRIQYSDAGLKKYTGPSGLIAGLMARTDSTRGVWKAPAGTEADLRGILDVEINLTDLENGVLNKLGVNCIRKFPSGIVNWGARTLDGSDDIGSEWKYIPIRRLALFLEESLFRGTQWVVFEPNDEPLWARIRQNIRAFMLGLFREGAFQGATPDKAFYVKCDGETTTANDRNLGIVNIEVGFAPLKPAEFVVIKIQQIADIEN